VSDPYFFFAFFLAAFFFIEGLTSSRSLMGTRPVWPVRPYFFFFLAAFFFATDEFTSFPSPRCDPVRSPWLPGGGAALGRLPGARSERGPRRAEAAT